MDQETKQEEQQPQSDQSSSLDAQDSLRSDDHDQPIAALDAKLQEFIELLRRIGMSTADYQLEGKDVYMNRINQVVDTLRELDQLKDNVNIDLPPAVIDDFIAKGHNPDTFTANQIQLVTNMNQKTFGRIRQLSSLKSEIEKEMKPNFPALHDTLQSKLNSAS
ncbi:hypothetical protein SmJEL517_g05249 [Synchytrium microbalum]|uniref:Mediator of RNA polymerase II transcription subunit 10 n=1 Tax=Synchytrium microbalum TaxID=1806994 RepID=A0A507BQ61_9FUNG|nr:uncharacterized protein SmJEL517_g05249 [Synchytrium microbalum]TPX31407.1 hypothetical protein SmJEL517_g05249 [Synchytrium microbalum]